MTELMMADNLTKEQKKACLHGEIVFDSQDQKLEALKDSINLFRQVINSHKKDKNYSLLMRFKLILYFLEEYRDILEQYELEFVDEEEEINPNELE